LLVWYIARAMWWLCRNGPSCSHIITSVATSLQISPHQGTASAKKRRRRRHRNRSNSCSEGSVGSHSSSDSTQQKKEPELSQEQQAQYLALDCEMVGVGKGGHRSILARVTVVDWNGNTVYDEYVQPTEPVTDYRTFISGITAQDLLSENNHAVDLNTCRNQVEQLLHGKILIGHALKNDLHALQIHHPWQNTRDTAKYEPFMKVRFDDGVLWPRKLRDLCAEKLHLDIQRDVHSPREDAVAALQLYKAVRAKWEKVMAYKIGKTAAIQARQQQQQHTTETTKAVASAA